MTPLTLADLTDFRRAIGLSAIVVVDEEYHLDSDADPVGPDTALATIAEELGKVEHAVALHDAQYRDWRAKLSDAILADNPKLAEWKVRAKLESLPAFLAYKEAAAALAGVRVALLGFADAIKAGVPA